MKSSAYQIFTLVVLLLIVTTSSCRRIRRTICTGPAQEEQAECQETILVANPRIELAAEPALHPSLSLWIRAGEPLNAKWDSFRLFISLGEQTCDFSQLQQYTDDCAICDWCETGPTYEQLCPFELREIVTLRLIPREGFMDPALTAIELNDTSGCSARGFSPVPFSPSINTSYELLPPQEFSDAPLTSKKVFVVGGETNAHPAVYPLTHHEEPHPNIVWYTWKMRGDLVWEDNFSQNVRITGIRILNGSSLIADPNSGRLMVADSRPVRASRVVLVPLFDPSFPVLSQDAYFCYANSAGVINLANCRANYQDTNGPLLDAVPTYMKSAPTELLTWVVEFNPNEGADPVPTTGVMAIEFTIEPV